MHGHCADKFVHTGLKRLDLLDEGVSSQLEVRLGNWGGTGIEAAELNSKISSEASQVERQLS